MSLLCFATWLALGPIDQGEARFDALKRLTSDNLEATHQAITALRTQRSRPAQHGPYQSYRANLHVHSALSHDSRGTIDEIVTAAKAAGTQIILFSEHPADHYDYYKDGHHGMRDGVLLIPGAEANGFLAYPKQSMRGLNTGSPQEFSDLVRSRGGLVFVSHLEERMSWEIRGVTGVEIYNTHANFKDAKSLVAALRNPLWLIKSADLFRKYPQEAFSALHDYPAAYLKRYDELCRIAPHTGVGANDAHQNIGLTIKAIEGNKARLEDALGKKLAELEVGALPVLAGLAKDKKPGEVLFQLRLDAYEHSLRHVGTHLMMQELTEKAVWEALASGRAFVAFDCWADATGFDYCAQSQTGRHEMGSRVTYADGIKLLAQAPLPVRWRVVRNGTVASESRGRNLELAVREPGVHRVEAWLTIAGEERAWILSNPVYIQASTSNKP